MRMVFALNIEYPIRYFLEFFNRQAAYPQKKMAGCVRRSKPAPRVFCTGVTGFLLTKSAAALVLQGRILRVFLTLKGREHGGFLQGLLPAFGR